MEKPLTLIELPSLTLPRVGPFPKIKLQNVKIKLSNVTFEAGFPFPKASFNFEVTEYDSEGIQPIVR